MPRTFRYMLALALASSSGLRPALADSVEYVDEGGVRYQVTRRTIQRQVPVTEMQPRQQTTYRQQITTENVAHQQLYAVPTTQYQVVSTLHGRWNPFVTPYWTHEYQPVTVWQQQVATVQLPVSRAAVVPETQTVQVPVTTYRVAAEEQMVKTPIGATPALAGGSSQAGGTWQSAAAAPTPAGSSQFASQSAQSAQPSAVLTARNTPPLASPPPLSGGVALESDPPRRSASWPPASDGRYR